MGMPTPELLMEYDGPRLTGQSLLSLNGVDRCFEGLDWDRFQLRRVEAQREQILLALGARRDCLDLGKRVTKIITDKATQFVHHRMLVVLDIQKVTLELLSMTSTVRVQDHRTALTTGRRALSKAARALPRHVGRPPQSASRLHRPSATRRYWLGRPAG